jgi:hypothetical protein
VSHPAYRLTVEVCPDRRLPPSEPDAPPAVTLRRALKQLWRCFRVRVMRAERLDASLPLEHGAGI